MTRIRLGAVSYLNARPLVFGLDRAPWCDVRYDVPSECARLLHAGDIDVGLIPSIEYLQDRPYRIVPDLAITSRGPVASVALFTTRPMSDVTTIVTDSSSRTSVALVRVLADRLFRIHPVITSAPPDLDLMLKQGEAALLIGDNALLRDAGEAGAAGTIDKIDLGQAWTALTGLPFVWAFWVGRPDALGADGVRRLQDARDEGVRQSDAIAREYFSGSPERQALGARYLQDNIKYHLGADERAGLEQFYRYAAEAGVLQSGAALRFYGQA